RITERNPQTKEFRAAAKNSTESLTDERVDLLRSRAAGFEVPVFVRARFVSGLRRPRIEDTANSLLAGLRGRRQVEEGFAEMKNALEPKSEPSGGGCLSCLAVAAETGDVSRIGRLKRTVIDGEEG